MYNYLTFGKNNSIIIIESESEVNMKTKKYFKLILKPYRIILKHFDSDIRLSIGKTFCCFPQLEEKEIEVPIFEDSAGKTAFYNKMQKRLKQYKIEGEFTSEILSFLHEIGHIYTYNRLDEIKYNFCTTLIKEIQAKLTNPKFLNFFYNCYFALKLERNADKWAMLFIKNNRELVDSWQEMLSKNYQKVMPKFIDHMAQKYHTDLLA